MSASYRPEISFITDWLQRRGTRRRPRAAWLSHDLHSESFGVPQWFRRQPRLRPRMDPLRGPARRHRIHDVVPRHGGTSVRLDDLPKLASPGSFQSVNPRAPAKPSAMYPVAATNRLTAGGARSSAGPRRNSVLENPPRTNAVRTATASFLPARACAAGAWRSATRSSS